MDRANKYFAALTETLSAATVRMSGAWTGKKQRRYASPTQLGTGEGPFVETVDWRWDGVFEGDFPLAGLTLLLMNQRMYWAKSQPPAARQAVSFLAHDWANRASAVTVTSSFHGTTLRSGSIEIRDEPPAGCVIGKEVANVGVPHLVAQLEGVVFGVLLLPGSAVQVGRNRLWHLREDIASRLPPSLRLVLTRGRTGEVDLRT